MSLLFFLLLFSIALVAFVLLAVKGRLDMNEKPKHQMMSINEKQPTQTEKQVEKKDRL